MQCVDTPCLPRDVQLQFAWCMYVQKHTYKHAHKHAHMCICVCVKYVSVYISSYVYIYIYISRNLSLNLLSIHLFTSISIPSYLSLSTSLHLQRLFPECTTSVFFWTLQHVITTLHRKRRRCIFLICSQSVCLPQARPLANSSY